MWHELIGAFIDAFICSEWWIPKWRKKSKGTQESLVEGTQESGVTK